MPVCLDLSPHPAVRTIPLLRTVAEQKLLLQAARVGDVMYSVGIVVCVIRQWNLIKRGSQRRENGKKKTETKFE